MTQAVLKNLHPEHVEVELCRTDELAQRRGLTSELDAMWSYVGKKAEPWWLWHAIDHHSGTVLAYVFGVGRIPSFSHSRAYWRHLVSHDFTQMDGAPTSGISPPSCTWSASSTPRKSRANLSICAPASSVSYAARCVFELVASFVNRSNLLKSWEKTDTCVVSTSGAHGPKNTAITRIPAHTLPRSRTHFSDRTPLV